MSERYKMEITDIGGNPTKSLEGWAFNGGGKGVGIEYDSETDQTYIAGYTIAELREIYERKNFGTSVSTR